MVNTDTQQGCKMGLSCINVGNTQGIILDATVNGANTYAVFRARVSSNGNAATAYGSLRQATNVAILRGMDQANAYGILTDTNLNGLTTVAQVQGLFTAQAPELPASYALSLPQ